MFVQSGSNSIFLLPTFWSTASGSLKMNFVPLFWSTASGSLKMNFVPVFWYHVPGFPIFQKSATFPEMSRIQLDCWMLYSAKVVILNGAHDAFHRLGMCFGFLTNTIKIKFCEFVGYFTARKSPPVTVFLK